jgi:hypothetical protein
MTLTLDPFLDEVVETVTVPVVKILPGVSSQYHVA